MSKIKIQMDKFPHLSNVKKTITSIKKEIELLNKRKSFASQEIESLVSPYTKNEIDITLLRTDREISRLYKTLNEQESHFKDYKEKLTSLVDEVNENYETFIKEKRKLIIADEKIRQLFDTYKQFDFDANWEAKIMLYHELKELEKPAPEK
jgi:predicted nuclease with TOPRIM domain